MCQIREFKENLIRMISNNFNINIYGPNGCGETHFIFEVIKIIKAKIVNSYSNLHKHMMYLKLSDLIDLERVLDKFQSFIIQKMTSQASRPDSNSEYSLDEICEIKLRKY